MVKPEDETKIILQVRYWYCTGNGKPKYFYGTFVGYFQR